MNIAIETLVHADIDRVWKAWISPEDIVKWNAASEDWHTPRATNDLREGGRFVFRMEAKDGSFGFDMGGTYTRVVPQQLIAYRMDDGRSVEVRFVEQADGVLVKTDFEAESENPADMQKAGWQSISDNFGRHVEAGKA